MKKYKTLIIIGSIIAFLILLSIIGRFTNKPEMILFFGNTCPHCKTVDEYIVANGVKDKLKFQELEVYNNSANARLLAAKAKECGLNTTNGIGVPFFFDGTSCLQGDEPIINFFKTK